VEGEERSYAERHFDDWASRVDLEPYLSKAQLKALIVFNERLPNIADDYKFTFRGFSWRPGYPFGTLCFKASMNGDALICFVASKTLLDAFVILLRKLSGGTLAWKLDRYS
jgi:hypothetical protein